MLISLQETLDNVLSNDFSFDESEFADISDTAKDFICRLLVQSPADRMTADGALAHRWLVESVSTINEPAKQKASRKTSYDRRRLKSFAARDRWQKCARVIAACGALRQQQQLAVA